MIDILILGGKSSKATTCSPYLRHYNKNELKNFQFYFGEPEEDKKYDYVLLLERPRENYHFTAGKVIYVCGEPVVIENLHESFYKQFDQIVTVNREIKHENIIYRELLPWTIGGGQPDKYNLEFFSTNDFSKEKTKLLCGITSNKAKCEGHILRQQFLKYATFYFKDSFDLYGRGINDFDDKIDFSPQYKYQIVIENCVENDYFTEKLIDSFLAGNFTFYYGAPNIKEYFPEESFIIIDINKPMEAMKIIENAINNNMYEKHIDDIKISKQRVLNEHNIFTFIKENYNTKQKYQKRKISIPNNKKSIKETLKKRLLDIVPYYFIRHAKKAQKS